MNVKLRITVISTIVLLIGVFLTVMSPVASADEFGEYTYTVSSQGEATIVGYSGSSYQLEIPSSLGDHATTAINGYAFRNCTSLGSVTIPDSVRTIGSGSFAGCVILNSIDVDTGNLYFSSVDGVLYNKAITQIVQYPCAKRSGFDPVFIVPDSVVSIRTSAFAQCRLESVVLPSGLKTIGTRAFDSCTSLQSISFQGVFAPTTIGAEWLLGTSADIRGHAKTISSFPQPNSVWHGLTMGSLLDIPGVPTNIIASINSDHTTISWRAPDNNGGSPIIGYMVYRSTAFVSSYSPLGLTPETTFTDTAPAIGQIYFYKISALNANGEGEQSSSISASVQQPPSSNNNPLIIVAGVIILILVLTAIRPILRRPKNWRGSEKSVYSDTRGVGIGQWESGMIHRRLAFGLSLLGVLLLVASLFLPQWSLQSNALNLETASMHADMYVFGTSLTTGTSSSFTYTQNLEAGAQQTLIILLITSSAAIMLAAIGSSSLRDSSRDHQKRASVALMMLASVVALASPLIFMLALPNSPSSTSSGYHIDFFGSMSVLGFSMSCGGGIGWFLQIAASILLIAATILTVKVQSNGTRMPLTSSQPTADQEKPEQVHAGNLPAFVDHAPCHSCNAQTNGSAFCGSCGEPMKYMTSQRSTQQKPSSLNAPDTQSPITGEDGNGCSNCGGETRGSPFCESCGNRLR